MTDPARLALRLSPNVLNAGDTTSVLVEHAAADLLDVPLTVELTEVDDDGKNGVAVARFTARVAARDGGGFQFASAERASLPADEEGDAEDPDARADVSRGGHTLPFETTWRQASLKLKLGGLDEAHRVVLRVADSGKKAGAEHCRYELGLVAKDGSGGALFDTGTQVSTVDCWGALAHNATAAAITQLQGQHWLVESHETGDYYGNMSSGGVRKNKLVTSCITFCLQVLERAYKELEARSDDALLNGAQQNGGVFARKIKRAGWDLVYFHQNKAAHDAVPKAEQDSYWRISQRALTENIFKSYQPKDPYDESKGIEVACQETLAEVIHSYCEDAEDAAGSARYDEFSAQIPFALVALRLGDHMAMKVGDRIYQCHWGERSDSARLFERAELSWSELKESGSYDYFYAAVPAGFLNASFPGQTEQERRTSLAPDWTEIAIPTGEWEPTDTAGEALDSGVELDPDAMDDGWDPGD